jgi:ABC-type arginine transport system permease subunit
VGGGRYTTAMSKRLQVVVADAELHDFERTAGALGLTLSAWVRQTLRAAEREVAMGDVEAKLAAIREASKHNFPEVDIDQMLAEIEQGYAGSADA